MLSLPDDPAGWVRAAFGGAGAVGAAWLAILAWLRLLRLFGRQGAVETNTDARADEQYERLRAELKDKTAEAAETVGNGLLRAGAGRGAGGLDRDHRSDRPVARVRDVGRPGEVAAGGRWQAVVSRP